MMEFVTLENNTLNRAQPGLAPSQWADQQVLPPSRTEDRALGLQVSGASTHDVLMSISLS